MEFHLVKIKPDACLCTSMFSGSTVEDLVKGIRETKKINFFVTRHTKTSLSIAISSGSNKDDSFLVVTKVEGFKFLFSPAHRDFLGGEVPDRYFFKVTKNQQMVELGKYLWHVMRHILEFTPDELDNQGWEATIRFFRTENMTIDIAENIEYEK